MLDVVKEVREGKAHVRWSSVESTYRGHKLYIYVFADAMKFDDVPSLRWDRKPTSPEVDPWHTNKRLNGVRLPASAQELQQIADITGSMLLTPKVIDLIWMKAHLRFDPVINTRPAPGVPAPRKIVATSNIHVVHQAIEEKILASGKDPDDLLVASVGKYWCLTNRLTRPGLRFGNRTACNYGWCSSAASGPGVTPGVKCWQRPGYAHNDTHFDPSQTIRLMFREGYLTDENGREERVHLEDVAKDPNLAGLLHHEEGPLTYLRQANVPPPKDDTMPCYFPDI